MQIFLTKPTNRAGKFESNYHQIWLFLYRNGLILKNKIFQDWEVLATLHEFIETLWALI